MYKAIIFFGIICGAVTLSARDLVMTESAAEVPRPLTKGEFVRLFRAKSKIDRGFDSAAWLRAHDLAEEDFQSKSLLLRLLTFGWL